jgi:nitrite reductase (NADH) small subunit
MADIFVCKAGELQDGDVRIVQATEKLDIGVYRHAGQYYAYRNYCTHQGGPACEGIVMNAVKDVIAADRTYQGQTFDESDPHIVCPWHGWEYHLKTGEHVVDPKVKLRRYDVVQREGGVYVIA